MSTKLNKLLNIRDRSPLRVVRELFKTYPKLKKRTQSLDVSDFPLVTSVNAGSADAASVLLFNPEALKTSKVALVGKGVCFDSGGYDLKPRSMPEMFFDKSGAILVADACNRDKTLPGIVFFVSNLVSEKSTLPGDIIVARDGTEVLITNTDAEGRLGLADCLTFLKDQNPKLHAISIATLTGAASYFSGNCTYSLIHSTDAKKLYPEIFKRAQAGRLKLWPAPLHKAYDKAIKTKVKGAKIDNCPRGFYGAGSQVAFSFLKHFNKNMTHLDIAGFGDAPDGNCAAAAMAKELKTVINLLCKLR